jgi:hypothetical protein
MPAKPQATNGVPRGGHESRDLKIEGLVLALVSLASAGVLIAAGIWWFQQTFHRSRDTTEPLAQSSADPTARPSWQGFATPRLQASPESDMKAYLRSEMAELHSAGWINKTAGIVRIPVERAMELLVQSGLPNRSNSPPQVGRKTPLQMRQERRITGEGELERVR